jgi:nucleotide-binding universal stress UspA family protein
VIKRILIGIGGTPFTAVAIRRAVDLGSAHGAQVTAVTVVDEARLQRVGPIPMGAASTAEKVRERRLRVTQEKVEGAIASLAEACAAQGVPLKVLRERGNPFALLAEQARYNDLMIFGLRSMFEYDVLGGDDVDPARMLNGLAKAGVSPILAVSEAYRPIRRALLAYDGSLQAAEVMKQFVRLNLWPGVWLRLMTCDGREAEWRPLLADAQDYCRAYGIETDTAHRSSATHEAILQEASDWDADLIVLGSSGRGAFATRVFGSTTIRVLRRADRPLFISR